MDEQMVSKYGPWSLTATGQRLFSRIHPFVRIADNFADNLADNPRIILNGKLISKRFYPQPYTPRKPTWDDVDVIISAHLGIEPRGFLNTPLDDVEEVAEGEPARPPFNEVLIDKNTGKYISENPQKFEQRKRKRDDEDDPPQPFRQRKYFFGRPKNTPTCCGCDKVVPNSFRCGRHTHGQCPHFVCKECGFFDNEDTIPPVCPCCIHMVRQRRTHWDGVNPYNPRYECCQCGLATTTHNRCGWDSIVNTYFDDEYSNDTAYTPVRGCEHRICDWCGFIDPRPEVHVDAAVCPCCKDICQRMTNWQGILRPPPPWHILDLGLDEALDRAGANSQG